jgi:mannose-6-phosphate isomerase-like protein (cupin superfamily)
MQRHTKRHEFWLVSEGDCTVDMKLPTLVNMATHSQVHIPIGDWHKLQNPYDKPCRIIEIQYGEACDELDIERETDA